MGGLSPPRSQNLDWYTVGVCLKVRDPETRRPQRAGRVRLSVLFSAASRILVDQAVQTDAGRGDRAFSASQFSSCPQEVALAFTPQRAPWVRSWALQRKSKHAAGSSIIPALQQPSRAALKQGRARGVALERVGVKEQNFGRQTRLQGFFRLPSERCRHLLN